MNKLLLGVIAVGGLLVSVGSVSAVGDDIVNPQLIKFEISPDYVDTTNGPQDVTVTFKATDDIGLCFSGVTCGAGSYKPQLTLSNEDDVSADLNYSDFVLTSGTAQHGYFQQTLSLPQGSAKDKWKVSSFMLCDTDSPVAHCKNFTKDNLEDQFGDDAAEVENTPYKVFRFWSDPFQGHFYTSNIDERDTVLKDKNWTYEGASYDRAKDSETDAKPVYRFWSENFKHHFYTVTEAEKERTMTDPNWHYELVAYEVFSSDDPSRKPVYRFWSDQKNGHFYTASQSEKEHIEATYDPSVWRYEGIAWYVKD